MTQSADNKNLKNTQHAELTMTQHVSHLSI